MTPENMRIDVDQDTITVTCQVTVDDQRYAYVARVHADDGIISETLTEYHEDLDQNGEAAILDEDSPTHFSLYDTSQEYEPVLGMWHEESNSQYLIADQDLPDQPERMSIDYLAQRFPYVKLLDSDIRQHVTAPLADMAESYARAIFDSRTASAPAQQPDITIYTKPDCVQCRATQRRLDAAGVPYKVTDISQDPEMIEQMRAAGFTAVPIVEYGEERFAGYQPDRIKALTQAFGAISSNPTATSDHSSPRVPRQPKTERRSR